MLVLIPFFSHANQRCSSILSSTWNTISVFRELEDKVLVEFKDFKAEPMLSFELLISSTLQSQNSVDGWVLLREVRDQVGIDNGQYGTAKRAIAQLFDSELWEAKQNPSRRTEKFIRPTEKGRAAVNRIIGEQ